MGLSGSGYFNLGQGLIGLGASAFGGKSKAEDIYKNARNPYEAALQVQQDAYDQEAQDQEQQSKIALEDAANLATQTGREASQFRENQANQYNASGVLLEGSPMIVLEQTRSLAQQEIDAIMKRGAAQASLLNRRAMITRNEGRAQILGANAKFNAGVAQSQIEAIRNKQGGLADLLSQIGSGLAQTSKTSAGAGAAGSKGGRSKLLSGAIPPPNTMLGTIHGALP